MGGAASRAIDEGHRPAAVYDPQRVEEVRPGVALEDREAVAKSVSENDSVFMIGGVGSRPSSIAFRCSRPDICRTSAGSATP